MAEEAIVFRRLTIADINEIMRLENLSFSHPWSREAYVHELTENDLAYYCGIFNGEKLLAFGGFWLIIDEGHIANIAVDADFRRQGWGELLLRRLILFCLAQGAKRITLEVRKHNIPARNLYMKLGFKDVGLRPGYYDHPRDDAIIMWLDMEDCRVGKRGLITDG